MGITYEEIDILFERSDKGLGLSIAGGIGSTPYKNNDEGIYVSRVTPGGPADLCGLRKDDRIIMVNGISCLRIDHFEVVRLLKESPGTIQMRVAREVFFDNRVSTVSSRYMLNLVLGPSYIFGYSNSLVY